MFWGAYSAIYDRLWDQPLHEHIIAEAIGHLDRGLPVEEVGAGTGLATRRLLESGFEVDASEPSAAMRRRFTAALPGVPVRAGSVEQMTPRPERADATNVLAVNVLQLVDDPAGAVHHLRRRAGAAGRVVVVVPTLDTTLGGLVRSMRARGASRRQCLRFLALQVLTAPLQAGAHVRARAVDLPSYPGLVHIEVSDEVHRLAVFRGLSPSHPHRPHPNPEEHTCPPLPATV